MLYEKLLFYNKTQYIESIKKVYLKFLKLKYLKKYSIGTEKNI